MNRHEPGNLLGRKQVAFAGFFAVNFDDVGGADVERGSLGAKRSASTEASDAGKPHGPA
jgi:hypothetical protein